MALNSYIIAVIAVPRETRSSKRNDDPFFLPARVKYTHTHTRTSSYSTSETLTVRPGSRLLPQSCNSLFQAASPKKPGTTLNQAAQAHTRGHTRVDPIKKIKSAAKAHRRTDKAGPYAEHSQQDTHHGKNYCTEKQDQLAGRGECAGASVLANSVAARSCRLL